MDALDGRHRPRLTRSHSRRAYTSHVLTVCGSDNALLGHEVTQSLPLRVRDCLAVLQLIQADFVKSLDHCWQLIAAVQPIVCSHGRT